MMTNAHYFDALGINAYTAQGIADRGYTIIFFGETGNDPDEEGSLALLAGLKKLSLVENVVVIANRLPALQRAQVARGTMDVLGVPETVVAIGEEYGKPQTNYDVQFGAPYMSNRKNFPGYRDVFWNTILNAEDQSVIVVLASGMTDAAELLKPDVGLKDPKMSAVDLDLLLQRKIINASIMGGLCTADEGDELPMVDGLGLVTSSWAATNNSHDWMSTFVTRYRLMDIGIPTVDIAKSTAYGAAIPRDAYDVFAETGHPVGVRLKTMQEALIQHLWYRANMDGDDPRREGLPPFLGAPWFNKVFCGNSPDVANMNGNDRIWNSVLNFQLYDQLAVLAGIPELRSVHFTPTKYRALNGAVVHSIGTTRASSSRTNLINPDQTRRALLETMMAGLEL